MPARVASDNTLKAYAKDWAHFARWCWMKGAEPLPPSSEMIGLYLADLADGSGSSPALSVSTIDPRLSGLAWNYAQRGFILDRKNRHIATVLAGIKRKHAVSEAHAPFLSDLVAASVPGLFLRHGAGVCDVGWVCGAL